MQVQLLRSSDTWLSLELNFYPVLVKNFKSLGHEVREIQTTEFPYLGIPKFVDSHLLTFKGFGQVLCSRRYRDSFHNCTISRFFSQSHYLANSFSVLFKFELLVRGSKARVKHRPRN